MYLKELEIALDENRIEKLFITDDVEEANRLLRQDKPVLIYLHSGNKEQSFSGFAYAVENPEDIDEEYARRVIQRKHGLPWKILETERCLVRETVEEDAEVFAGLYRDASVAKYMPPLPADTESIREIITAYRKEIYGFYEFGIWTVVEKATGQVIGRAGLEMKEDAQCPELGYLIGVPWQGKGYATEVCAAILAYAKENLEIEKVSAFVKPENVASLAVCRKLEFDVEETIQKTETRKDGDLIVFTKFL